MAKDFAEESEYFGQDGLLKWALGIVNIAMWDAWGKVNGQPVWKVLRASRTEVPVYGSGGWLSYSDDELTDNRMEIEKGMARSRQTLGWGFEFLKDKLTQVQS